MKRAILLPALALAALVGVGLYWRRARAVPLQTRVLILDPEPSGALPPEQAKVLGLLLVDELESRGDVAVTPLPALPAPFNPEGDLLLIRPKAAREGDGLRLTLEWAAMGPGRDGAWHRAAPPAGSPASTVHAALAGLPLDLASEGPSLLPSEPSVFWGLLQAEGAVFSNVDLDGSLAQAESLIQKDPRCASLHTAIAQLATVRMLQTPQLLDGHADQALQAADQALQLVPGHPRAMRYASRLLSDQGHQDEALTELQDGLKRHPHSINLLLAVDYAARTAGLLDIAMAARERMDRLWSGAPVPPPTGFTYLYAGHMREFEASFHRLPGAAPNGFTAFNRGYAALLQGRGAEAVPAFQITEQDPTTEAQFRALAKVFRFQIEGHGADAKAALDGLERARLGLQVPDGEFTITMAEAAAFLGEEGLAMDLAQQAASQGFLCAAWYRNSPFLAKLQPLPRWQSILQHVDARRARLAARHAPSDFGL